MSPRRQLSQLTVNLSLLASNIAELKKLQPNKEILFMVKADAYGHGLLPIVKYSYEESGVRSFGVASFEEALTIREEFPEMRCDIFVFSELALDLEHNCDIYLNYRIFPILSSSEDLDIFLKDRRFKNFPLCLKFNTGMNRLGLSCEEVEEVAGKLKSAGRNEVFHLMSHLANASMPIDKNKRNIHQQKTFFQLKESLRQKGIKIIHSSIANSAALEQGFKSEDDYIRPGLMLYGASSLSPKHKELSIWEGITISKLESTVMRVFQVERGEPLSYGSTPSPDNGKAIILPLGYGDGVSTKYQGAKINFGFSVGHVCARVCMDMITILFSDDTPLERGQKLALWDHKKGSLNRLSEEVNIIPYELVIQLTPRLPRFYTTS